METRFVVYGLCDPRTGALRYIGITAVGAAHRFTNHMSDARRGSPFPVHRWIRKLLSLSLQPRLQILEETHDLNRETFYILLHRGSGCRLLNCTDGGEGLFNPSAEVRAKISAAHRGKKLSPEQIDLLRRSHQGKKLSAAHRAKIAAHGKGRKHRPESIEKMRAAKTGKPRSAETIAKMSAALKGKKMPPRTEAYRAAISAAHRGKKKSPEAIAKHAAAMRGKKMPPRSAEHRAKIAAANRGRPHPSGEQHPMSKLTDAQRDEICRRRAAGGVTVRELAIEFAIGASQIQRILQSGNIPAPRERTTEHRRRLSEAMQKNLPQAKLGPADVLLIRTLRRDERLTEQELAARFGVSRSSIAGMLQGRTWKHVITLSKDSK